MGDEIIVKDVQLIQGGLLQIDLMNMDTNESFRVISEGKIIFGLLADSMANASEEIAKGIGFKE